MCFVLTAIPPPGAIRQLSETLRSTPNLNPNSGAQYPPDVSTGASADVSFRRTRRSLPKSPS